jgi:hypothetical protein
MVEQECTTAPRSSLGSYTPESPAVAGQWRYKRYWAIVEQHHVIGDAVVQMGICYAVGVVPKSPRDVPEIGMGGEQEIPSTVQTM